MALNLNWYSPLCCNQNVTKVALYFKYQLSTMTSSPADKPCKLGTQHLLKIGPENDNDVTKKDIYYSHINDHGFGFASPNTSWVPGSGAGTAETFFLLALHLYL